LVGSRELEYKNTHNNQKELMELELGRSAAAAGFDRAHQQLEYHPAIAWGRVDERKSPNACKKKNRGKPVAVAQERCFLSTPATKGAVQRTSRARTALRAKKHAATWLMERRADGTAKPFLGRHDTTKLVDAQKRTQFAVLKRRLR
jgi:hypothetical protein